MLLSTNMDITSKILNNFLFAHDVRECMSSAYVLYTLGCFLLPSYALSYYFTLYHTAHASF